MTSSRQIDANRRNARRSTGPRTAVGKHRSRLNAFRHGLTAETVIATLESADDYHTLEASLLTEHDARSATERELVLRLASVLWRLRRATQIETGLFATEAELMEEAGAISAGRPAATPPPQWLDDVDLVNTSVPTIPLAPLSHGQGLEAEAGTGPKELAACFLRVSRLGYGTFDLLNRYETALWRQAAQILFILRSVRR